jgi:hypothetical protein
MAVPPIPYRATDYPPKYRPLGYWRHPKPVASAPDEEEPPRRGRRALVVILAALALTLVLHAGIAYAFLHDRSSSVVVQAPKKAQQQADPGAACNQQSGDDVLDENQASDGGTQGASDAQVNARNRAPL